MTSAIKAASSRILTSLTAADVDRVELRVILHQEHAGIGQVVDEHEFTLGRAASPDRDLTVPPQLRHMHLAHQRRQNVARLKIEVIANPVEIGRHGRYIVVIVLDPIGLTHP